MNFDYVRPLKKRDLQNQYAKIVRQDNLRVETIDGGYILPLRKVPGDNLLFGRGGVLDRDGRFVELSSIPGRIEGKYETESFDDSSDETVVYCGYLVNHWGHFLIEAVNRLWYYLDHKDNAYTYVYIVEEKAQRELSGNYKEFFELLGIADKIELINTPKSFRRIIVPECAFSFQTRWSVKYREIFDAVIWSALSSNFDKTEYEVEKVFLSRARFPKAKKYEIGLDMLDSFFENNGYKVLYPESLPLTELILYLQSAKECAAESGTTPHNILFGYEKQSLTIVERQCVINPTQQAIDIIRDADVTYIDGHYMIYPVNQSSGPYFLAYNKYLKKYADARGYSDPSSKYIAEAHIRKNLNTYFNTYKQEHYYLWGIEGWELRCADTIYEAYCESLDELKPFLSGDRIFRVGQVFEFRFIKKAIKKLLRMGH